jgi:hypothetical protein
MYTKMKIYNSVTAWVRPYQSMGLLCYSKAAIGVIRKHL